MPTQLFITLDAAIVALCGILLFIARDRSQRMDVLTWWALAMFCGTLGLAIMLAPLPPLAARRIAGTVVMAGGVLSWVAARRFAGRPLHLPLACTGLVIWLAGTQLPAIVAHDAYWIALSWGMGAAYTLAIVYALWPDGVEHLPARPAMLVFMSAHGFLYALHALAGGLGLEDANLRFFTNLLLLEGQFRTIGVAFLVLTLSKQRAELAARRNLDAAQQASEARRRFVAHMSHEVRTPLNGVLGVAQILARDARLLPDQQELVHALASAGRHLMAIVNDTLDLAKIDAGRLDLALQPFNPATTAEECLALMQPIALDRRITLRMAPGVAMPRSLVGDQTRLQQILLNLLSNAVKFTPKGGVITLRTAMVSDGVRFEVSDTGPGVTPEQRHLLFKDFSQLDPGVGQGTGLGLAICARLTAHMGGSLQYLPGEGGHGSTFRLTLPWTAAPAGTAEPEADAGETPASPERLRLLIVDDVKGNRMVLRAMLSIDGHEVTEARDGAEALGMLLRQRFDALLLDLHMPRMNGLELTERLRAMPGWTREVPVIGVSADAMPETLQACRAAGMNIMLTKPIERDALTRELRRLCGRPGQAAALSQAVS